MTKRLRVFAGPNGSGKSSIEELVSSRYNIGKFINADNIERTLRLEGALHFSKYNIRVTNGELKKAFKNSGFNEKQDLSIYLEYLSVKSNILKIRTPELPYSYLGAILSEFIRNRLLDGRETFSFETVMSHSSKLELLEEAKLMGFKTYLYFVCTASPAINVGE